MRKLLVSLVVFAAIMLGSYGEYTQGDSVNEPSSQEISSQPTAILGAFGKELAILEQKLTNNREHKIQGIRFVEGEINGRHTVVALSGVGKVNAAMTATLLIEHFKPSEVIFTGIAGGINPELLPGDIVIGLKTIQHDLGMLTAGGLERGGTRNPIDEKRNPVFFPADSRILKLAQISGRRVKLGKIKTSSGERTPKIIEGIIATGDVFVASNVKRIELRKSLQADAVEMEGAAVAQICWQQGVPCLVVRSLSDKADEKASEDLSNFYEIAAGNSATLVADIVRQLGSENYPDKPKKGPKNGR